MRPRAFIYVEHAGRHCVAEVEQDIAGYRVVGPPRDDYDTARKDVEHLNVGIGVTRHRARAILSSALAAQSKRDHEEHGWPRW